jgi:GxxExxY protein
MLWGLVLKWRVWVEVNDLTDKIIGACIEVHKHLRPGLLESPYEECLAYELGERGIEYLRQLPVPVVYKGVHLDCGYKIDILVLVENTVVLELKAVEALQPVHEAQLLTYLKLTNLRLGLLINFNVPKLVQGIKRLIR